MTFDPNEVLDLDFTGIEPAVPGTFILLPSGEYQLQCVGARKYFTGESKGSPDPNKPNIEFKFTIINHTLYQGHEMTLSHALNNQKSRQFLLNTLMCILPDKNWQQGGIKVPLGQLIQAVQGRPVNAIVYHDSFLTNDVPPRTLYSAKIKGLKRFDPTVPAPMPSDTNPPKYMLEPTQPAPQTPTQQQAAAGVSQEEQKAFLEGWPGGTPTQPAPSQSSDFGFDEPF